MFRISLAGIISVLSIISWDYQCSRSLAGIITLSDIISSTERTVPMTIFIFIEVQWLIDSYPSSNKHTTLAKWQLHTKFVIKKISQMIVKKQGNPSDIQVCLATSHGFGPQIALQTKVHVVSAPYVVYCRY